MGGLEKSTSCKKTSLSKDISSRVRKYRPCSSNIWRFQLRLFPIYIPSNWWVRDEDSFSIAISI